MDVFKQQYRHGGAARALLFGSASLLALAGIGRADAGEIETNIPDLSLRWDNTITENVLERTENAPAVFLNSPNNDDTDRNIPHGLAAARTDLLSEVDVKYGDFGARGSAAAWYDAVYSHNNANDSPDTLNSYVSNNQKWPLSTQQLVGYHAEVQDLFTYGAFSPTADQRFSYRIGQFAQLWGESLFLATNSIAYGMNPIDGIKGQLLLNPQAKDVFMPTPQVSFTYQPTAPLSLSAYYKLGFRQTRVAPVGSYFATTDVLDASGNKIYVPLGGGQLGYFARTRDLKPNGADGQFGVSVRYNLGDYNLGLYALRFDEPSPQIIYTELFQNITSPQLGNYQVVYPKGIQLYGTSISGNIFDVINFGAELSARHDTDLQSSVPPVGNNAGTGNNPAYAIGDTLHGLLSFIYASPPVPSIGADQVQVLNEVGFNQLLGISRNKDALAPGVNHFASLGELVLMADYYSVRPGWDLTPSIGVAGQICGTSAVDGSERAHTGSFNLGLKAVLNQKYNFQIRYQHYMGKESETNPNLDNLLLGRDFVGVSFSTTL